MACSVLIRLVGVRLKVRWHTVTGAAETVSQFPAHLIAWVCSECRRPVTNWLVEWQPPLDVPAARRALQVPAMLRLGTVVASSFLLDVGEQLYGSLYTCRQFCRRPYRTYLGQFANSFACFIRRLGLCDISYHCWHGRGTCYKVGGANWQSRLSGNVTPRSGEELGGPQGWSPTETQNRISL